MTSCLVLVEVDVKSQAGKRGIGIPDSLWALIEKHELAQRAEREHAGTERHKGEWMFTGPSWSPWAGPIRRCSCGTST